jgi:nucleoside-diphosphate-sugar epimerase
MHTRTVLVTGGAGAVGTRLLEALAETGWRTRCLVHRRRPHAADDLVQGDVTVAATIDDALVGVDAIVHAAAVTHARTARQYEEINVRGTRTLVERAEKFGIRRFVLISTRAIALEGGAYSASKNRAEEIVRSSTLDWTIIRLPEIYGMAGSEAVGRIIAAARAGRRIPVVGHGTDVICPAHVDDVTRACARALDEPRAVRQVYTLAGPCMTVREFAELAARSASQRARVLGVPTPMVAALAMLGRFMPLPIYPDQLARLRAPKPPPSTAAEAELGFAPRHPSEMLSTFSPGE